MKFSLFYFADDAQSSGADQYHLLKDGPVSLINTTSLRYGRQSGIFTGLAVLMPIRR